MPRVSLPKETQLLLCSAAKKTLNLSWAQLAGYLGVTPRAFENWYRGINLLPDNIFTKLANISNFSIKTPALLPDNWGRVKGGRVSIVRHGGSFWTREGSIKGGTNSAKSMPCQIIQTI